FAAEQAPLRHGERIEYLKNATAYGIGASPEYLQSVGMQAGATDPNAAFAAGYQQVIGQQQQAEMQRKLSFAQQTQAAQQGLVNELEYAYSPQDKQRFAQLSSAEQSLYTN